METTVPTARAWQSHDYTDESSTAYAANEGWSVKLNLKTYIPNSVCSRSPAGSQQP